MFLHIRQMCCIFLVQHNRYISVQMPGVLTLEENDLCPGVLWPFSPEDAQMTSERSWCIVELVEAEQLTWQVPTRPVSQLPSSSRCEKVQHELRQATDEDQRLPQTELLQKEQVSHHRAPSSAARTWPSQDASESACLSFP